MIPPRWLLPALVLLGIASLAFALAVGSVDVSPGQVWASLTTNTTGLERTVVMELRWPRAASAFATGGMLALAGALLQVLLRNPLADPYILGISGGAAVGALLTMLLGLGGFWLTGSAFAGALLAMLLVFSIAHGRGSWTPTRLLLTGVVVAFGWGAVISFILAIAPEQNLHGMLFWLMGDLSHASRPYLNLSILVIGTLICLPMARNLNVMVRGDLPAAALGVPVSSLRWQIYVLASLLTAVAVTIAGSVGFIGLVVPHMLRLISGSDHRILLPASVLLGGALLVLADTLARTVIAPNQLPVGVLTAMLGVPLFLYLLRKGQTS